MECEMPEIRETHVERDADGRVTDTKVVVEHPKRKGGFGWGMLFGVLIIAGAIIAFAYSQGSFQQAGVEADQATAQIEDQTSTVAENTGDALESAGDTAEQATN
jgi:cytoskeletal protein RodZ